MKTQPSGGKAFSLMAWMGAVHWQILSLWPIHEVTVPKKPHLGCLFSSLCCKGECLDVMRCRGVSDGRLSFTCFTRRTHFSSHIFFRIKKEI